MLLSITSRSENGIAILQIHGSLTLGPRLRTFQSRADRALSEAGCNGLVLNFSSVSVLDSAGIGELVMLHSTASSRGIPVALVQASPRVKELLRTTRLHVLFACADDEKTAVGEFRRCA